MFCNGCGQNLTNEAGSTCLNCGTVKPQQAHQNPGTDYQQLQSPAPSHYQHTPSPHSPYTPYGSPPVHQPGKSKAIASLVLGICAMVVPIPILDIIMGVVGLALASMAGNEGYRGGIRTGGLVCSIIGTVWAVIFTITCLATCGAARSLWWLL